MRLFDQKRLGFFVVLSVVLMFGGSLAASAQGNSRWAHEKNRIRKEQKAIEKERKHGYRLYRGDRYYQTDQRGVDLIRRAIRNGYSQGYRAGANDRRYRRGDDYRDDSYYRRGNYGYQNYVDLDEYQHYYREGYERGYNDGYNGQSRYGSYGGGRWSILGSILNGILNLRSY
jgi:hypothetical protein